MTKAGRYSIRILAHDHCAIPVLGFKRWRVYWLALIASYRLNRGRAADQDEPFVVWDCVNNEPVGAWL